MKIHGFDYAATDDQHNYHTIPFTLIENFAPTTNASSTVANQTIQAYTGLNYTIPTDIFVDGEGDAMNYSAVVDPAAAFISVAADIASLNVTTANNNSHAGNYTISLRATDTHYPETTMSKCLKSNSTI